MWPGENENAGCRGVPDPGSHAAGVQGASGARDTDKPWLKGTVWWPYNGVTVLVDHYMANRSRIKDKTSYVLRGDGAALKDVAFYRCSELVNLIKGTGTIEFAKVGIDREKWFAAA
jgi:hypothetical protein